MQNDDPVIPASPPSAGQSWRERFHEALGDRLPPEHLLNALLDKLPDDPVGVFRAIAATLPKEVDLRTEPQTHHLILLKLVGQAQAKGIDLQVLLEPPTVDAEPDPEAAPEWLR